MTHALTFRRPKMFSREVICENKLEVLKIFRANRQFDLYQYHALMMGSYVSEIAAITTFFMLYYFEKILESFR